MSHIHVQIFFKNITKYCHKLLKSRVIRELNRRAARFLSMPLGAKILGSNFGRSGRSANSLGVGQPFKANFNI